MELEKFQWNDEKSAMRKVSYTKDQPREDWTATVDQWKICRALFHRWKVADMKNFKEDDLMKFMWSFFSKEMIRWSLCRLFPLRQNFFLHLIFGVEDF